MSALTLISGRLSGEPTTRPTRNGGTVSFCKLKVASGNRIEFWSVTIFSDAAREELVGLSDGDALSAVGELHVETYEWKGETRIVLKLTADRVLALKRKPVKSKDAKSSPTKTLNASARALAAASWAELTRGGVHDGDDGTF
jgi:single-stranded DNA-binding protein